MHYFPSYEIITEKHSRGGYFAQDLRSVTEAGVAHVMRLFLYHASGEMPRFPVEEAGQTSKNDFLAQAEALVEVECDEIALDKQGASPVGSAA